MCWQDWKWLKKFETDYFVSTWISEHLQKKKNAVCWGKRFSSFDLTQTNCTKWLTPSKQTMGLIVWFIFTSIASYSKSCPREVLFPTQLKCWIVFLRPRSMPNMDLQFVFGWNTKTWLIPLMRNWCFRVENLTGTWNVFAPENHSPLQSLLNMAQQKQLRKVSWTDWWICF